MALLERAELDALLARNPRELAAIVARAEDAPSSTPSSRDKRGLDTLLADLGKLLATAGDLVLAIPPVEPLRDDEVAGAPPSSKAPSSLPSWIPTDWTSAEVGATIADAFERGTMTFPRCAPPSPAEATLALDAIGAEMFRVAEHPFASAAFAELLARSGRARDVIRLVTYFAVAPDPDGRRPRPLDLPCPRAAERPALLAGGDAPHRRGPGPSG